jgi:tRNA A-37 threonylcarbamoyl transferase component Bud32
MDIWVKEEAVSGSTGNATLLAKGTTADVYAWGEGRVLKLFTERTPWHANEVAATRATYKACLPVPQVMDGLIEVGQREGIVFERVDGPIMTEYLQDHPGQVEDCARQAAELQVRIHATAATELPPLIEILKWTIAQADPLEGATRRAVLDLLGGLPGGESLCHNDFHPSNIIVSGRGLVAIDWAIGTRCNPLADYARTWLVSRMWLDGLETGAPEQERLLWQRFWSIYLQRYGELRPFSSEALLLWQIVAAAASLTWDRSIASTAQRVSFVQAALGGAEHPWLSDGGHREQEPNHVVPDRQELDKR